MKTQVMIVLVLAAGTAMAQRGERNRRPPPSAEELVEQMDKDNDGKISEDEFKGPSGLFTQFDADSDGYVSEAEITAAQAERQQGGQREGESSNEGFVERLDEDGDGKVSSSEFDGPSEAFSDLDKDGDGYLSDDEAPSGPPPRGRRK